MCWLAKRGLGWAFAIQETVGRGVLLGMLHVGWWRALGLVVSGNLDRVVVEERKEGRKKERKKERAVLETRG